MFKTLHFIFFRPSRYIFVAWRAWWCRIIARTQKVTEIHLENLAQRIQLVFKPRLLQPDVIVIIHIADADDRHVLHIVVQALHQIAANQTGGACDQCRFPV